MSDYYTCRSYTTIGNVTAGAKRTFSVSLAVQTGDFIGIYWSGGDICSYTEGGDGVKVYVGDAVGQSDVEFPSHYVNQTRSLWGDNGIISIDVGSAAVWSAGSSGPSYTILLLNNPAEGDGTITNVEIYAASNMSGVKVGIFYDSGAPVLPTVTTQAADDIGDTFARGNGNIIDLGNPDPTQHGHCWSTSADPTTADSKTSLGAASATGAFISSITELTKTTLYHCRAYATNAAGTAYGADVTFTALTTAFPSDPLVRVTNLVHRYNRAEGSYTLELALGEVTSDFGLPQWLSEPKPTMPVDPSAEVNRAMRKAGLKGGLFEARTGEEWRRYLEEHPVRERTDEEILAAYRAGKYTITEEWQARQRGLLPKALEALREGATERGKKRAQDKLREIRGEE